MKKSVKFAFSLFLYVSCVMAESEYRGLIVAHIVEPNGHVYRGYEGFIKSGEFEDSQVIYLEQERGQTISLSGRNVLIDSSTANKYYMTFRILDRSGEKYQAEVSFFRNTMEYQKSRDDYLVVSRLIKRAKIDGVLRSENEYVFIDNNKPNLKLLVNIDRIFTKDEILSRLKSQLAKPSDR